MCYVFVCALPQVLADVGSRMPDKTRAFFATELLKVVCAVSAVRVGWIA